MKKPAINTLAYGKRLLDTVMSKVEMIPFSGCWLFYGGGPWGYGTVTIWDYLTKSKKTIRAHRVTYEYFIGPIAPGLDLDHWCRVRCCVNPDHLEPVTSKVNNLRGLSPSSINAAKIACSKGHLFVEGNLKIISTTGERRCRMCERANKLAYRARLKEGKCQSPSDRAATAE